MEKGELRTADYLELVTRLLQRCRLADPKAGVWEAADFQWWWRRVRSSDDQGQLFWFDGSGEPVAALVLTDWDGTWQYELVVVPEHSDALFADVWQGGLARIDVLGLETVEVSARDDDVRLTAALTQAGFTVTADASTGSWLDANDRPEVSPLPPGYGLRSRADTADRPHHMIGRNGEHVGERLAECSLYDPELDLLVESPDGEVAAYALFWPDPVTRVGLVEPMRTEDAHQRRGLARHLLTAGLDKLAARGCTRLKIGFVDGNPASRNLYLSAGFVPEPTSRVYRR